MDHYLKGNWFEAEYLLSGLLAANPRDVDAGLMLATLWRHTGRFDEALEGLARLERCEDAKKWQWEIGQERDLVRRAQMRRVEPDPVAAVGVTAAAAGRAEAA
jgi:thioredoxin-like negative regulator of GroEL